MMSPWWTPMRNSMRFFFKYRAIALRHAALDLDGTTRGIDDAGKLRQEPVAGGFDDAPAVLGDLLVDPGSETLLPH